MTPSWVKGQDMAFGIYGHRAEQRTSLVSFAGRNDFESFLIGGDLSLPLTKRIKLQGEWWFGENLSDVRGAIGQNINPATGREIKAKGGWGELSIKTNRFHTVNLGYTLDVPKASMVPANGRTRNRTMYITNRFALGSGVDVGFDYANWITHFNGLSPGQNNRFTIYVQHNF
jgi:hypothetical protein